MEIATVLLRMTMYVFRLLLLLQFSGIFASGGVIQSKVCGADHIAYSDFHKHELFYLNGKLVNRDMFCEAVKFHYVNGCIFEGYVGTDYCRLDLTLVDFPFKNERKLLQAGDREKSSINNQKTVKNERKKPLSTPQIVGIALGIFVACCALLCPCFWRKRKATAHTVLAKDPHSMDSVYSFEINSASEKILGSPSRVPPSPRFSMSPKLTRYGSLHLNLSQVTRATENFSKVLQIGEGGFGTVYKADLGDGRVVAIKRAKREHFESLQTEFSSEVQLLAKIDHRSLVKLLGYVDTGTERLIITEYMPNGTLREYLDGQHGKILDFNQRLEIAIDVAHGLTYLHQYAEKQIIHRDVKSSNILLTESMRAKVADFGFARIGHDDSEKSHVLTKVKGTVGYLDPEYMKTYQLTPKSDVYSFGILLIEIFTGCRPVELKRPNDERVTLRWAFKKFNEGKVAEIVDPLMEEAVDEEILVQIIGLAIQCAAPIRAERPDMNTVGKQLWAIRADYHRSGRRT